MYKKSKYGNKITVLDGEKHDSKGEATRHAFLKMMEQAGEISDLRYHVNFDLIPKGSTMILRTPDGKEFEVKKYDRKRWYEADFVYINKSGEEIIEDFKGYETKEFKEKRELMKILYNKEIKLVKRTNEAVN